MCEAFRRNQGFQMKLEGHDTVLTNAGVYTDGQLGPQYHAVLLPSGPEKEGKHKKIIILHLFSVFFFYVKQQAFLILQTVTCSNFRPLY